MPGPSPDTNIISGVAYINTQHAGLFNSATRVTTLGTILSTFESEINAEQTAVNTAQNSANDILADQRITNDILDTEYTRLLAKKQKGDDILTGQDRMIRLNETYRLKYAEYMKIVYVIVALLLSIFIVYQLWGFIQLYIPSFLIEFFIVIAVSLSITYCYFIYAGIQARDPNDFNKLNMNDINNATIQDNPNNGYMKPILSPSKDLNKMMEINQLKKCIGSSCCSTNTHWDQSTNTCIPN